MPSINLVQYITMFSRITYHTNTVIDYIFIRFPLNKCHGKVISGNNLAYRTDHLPTFSLFNFSESFDQNSRPYICISNDQNILKLTEKLHSINWTEILDGENPD